VLVRQVTMNLFQKQCCDLLLFVIGIVMANPINNTITDNDFEDDDDNSTHTHCCSKSEEGFLISAMVILVLSLFGFVLCGMYVCNTSQYRQGYKSINQPTQQIPNIHG
jgi:hypothetical protein